MIARAYLPLVLISSAWSGGLDFSLKDAKGRTHTAADLRREKATVFVFVSTDCPNSNAYAPILSRLYREYSPRGVAFFNVYSDPSESSSTVRKHDTDYDMPFAALLDPHQTLARATGARSTPEVVILGPAGQQLYRGRVDNRVVELGKARYKATENDLQEALDAILQGKAAPHPVTRAIGCAIPGIK
jgi:peroxiredoxin